jgi:hypothetical protein
MLKPQAAHTFENQNNIAGAAETTVIAANVAADAQNLAAKMQSIVTIQTFYSKTEQISQNLQL